MLRLTLPAEDRAQLGAPEVIEIDIDRPTLGQIRALHEQVGWSWDRFQSEIRGERDDADRLYAAGVLYWLAVIGAGIRVTWAEFDLDFLGVGTIPTTAPNEADPGNTPAPDGASIN